jgi:trigger factor
MQVTELSNDGLKREYKVVVPSAEIEGRVSARLTELSKTIRMPGFRPGKVPISLLKKQYGRSVMGEVLEQAVNQGSQATISERELKPALRPKIEVTSFDEGADLEFTMALEVLPEIPETDLKALRLTRPVAPVSEDAVERALHNLVQRSRRFEPTAEPRPSRDGDQVIIDFEGRIEGEPFEGGTAEDFALVLGSGAMIPSFEDQLKGLAGGSEVKVEATLPESYPQAELAGKAATFEVKVKEVREAASLAIDDDLAKGQGFDDLAAMKKVIRESIEREYGRFSRAKVKRALLDRLAEEYRFGVPAGMVDLEFDAIWKQIKDEIERTGNDSGKSEDELREEYRAIAERRVRLGLILSDIGQKNELKVEQHELNAAIVEQAQRYPGQQQKVFDFFRSNPQAIEQLRAPLYEDKVVDFILQMANVKEATVTPEELMRDPDEDGEAAAEPGEPTA